MVNDLLDLARINIDAIDEQHVLLAIGDEVIAVFVAMADVAGAKPAVNQHLRRGLGLVPVTLHDVAAADDDLARLVIRERAARLVPDGHLDAENRQAHRAGFALAVDGIQAGDRAGFTQAVAFDERQTGRRLELTENFAGQRRATADANTEWQSVLGAGARQCAEELRHRRQDGGLVPDDLENGVLRRMQ